MFAACLVFIPKLFQKFQFGVWWACHGYRDTPMRVELSFHELNALLAGQSLVWLLGFAVACLSVAVCVLAFKLRGRR